MSKRAELEITLGGGAKGRGDHEERPLRLLVLADFSGRRTDSPSFAANRFALHEADACIANLSPVLKISTSGDPGPAQGLTVASLDEFHPDALVAAVPALRRLLDIARKLDDPASEGQALAELAAIAGAPAGGSPASEPESRAPAAESQEQLLSRLLGGAKRSDGNERAKAAVKQLIQGALQPHQRPAPAPGGADARTRVAQLLNQRCRALLRDPQFRAVERAWRSVCWLASRLEDDQAEIHLVDVSKQDLARHIAACGGRLDSSPLSRLLERDGDERFDAAVGDYSFALDADDLTLLATLGAMGARAGVPFLAHGDLGLVGCADAADPEAPATWRHADPELAAVWHEFRRHPAARWVGLAAPRFLLRQPYGAKTDPVERFAFEELPVRPDREAFLWGNPAFACALLLTQGRTGADAAVWPNAAGGDVPDLPMPLYRDGGGEAIQPPLELLLNERARHTASDGGLIPLAGGRNTNRVAVGVLQSFESS
ncbi:MAG TPA: type VI secretion system contractile sheath large subunit [Gammaproteobacteria bacterium]|nr:type VI secretion system contractile sheath large subunit [Gammaproteobacteria bacterium]